MKYLFPVFLAIAFGLSVVQCRPSVYAEEKFEIDEAGWYYADQFPFTFEIDDTSAFYNLSMRVEHTTEYAYENLYVHITTTYPNGNTLSEPLSLQLADKTGRWYGRCRGSLCKLDLLMQEHIRFPEPGRYLVEVEQYMRIDPVPEIRAISLALDVEK